VGRIRTIKPEFPQSESIGKLSREARLLFIQLWTAADDEGRLRGASRMLASTLYPYDEDAPQLIEGWLLELETNEHIRRYVIAANTYIEIINFSTHQKIDHPSKSRLPAFAKPRESSRRKVSRTKDQDLGKGSIARSVPPEELAGTLPLVDGSDFQISKEQVKTWTDAYPGVEVKTSLKQAKAWLEANPTRKKTRKGIMRFTVAWLDRAQNSGGANGRQDQKRIEGNVGAQGSEDGPDLYAALYGPVEQGKLN